jgi:hypothetical protein
MGSGVMCTGEANYFRDYKRLGGIAKLATSYISKEEATSQCESMETGSWSTERSLAHTAWLLQTRLR